MEEMEDHPRLNPLQGSLRMRALELFFMGLIQRPQASSETPIEF